MPVVSELRVLPPREIVDSTPWEVVLEAFIGAVADSPQTVRGYRRHCVAACGYLGISSLSELNGAMLADYRAYVVGNRRLAPGSRAVALTAFRSFVRWSWVIGAHHLDERVIKMSLRGIRGTVKHPYQILSPTEIGRAWRAAAENPLDLALLSICLGAGLRTSEITQLQIPDLYADLEGGPALHVRQGKGGRDRIVPMREEFFRHVLAYLGATGRDLPTPGPVFVPEGPWAKHRRDTGFCVDALGVRVTRILDRAGVRTQRMSVHSLRHMYALSVLHSSGNVVAVQALLGHANLATTMRYLDHLRLGELRAALPGPPVLD